MKCWWQVTDDCAAEVAAMKKALKRLKLYPFTAAP